MADFIEAVRLDQIQPGTGSRFTIAGKDIAIFNVDGIICAIADTCPHAGGSLGMGKLSGTTVTCPVHGMKFDVTNWMLCGHCGRWSRLLSGESRGRRDLGRGAFERENELNRRCFAGYRRDERWSRAVVYLCRLLLRGRFSCELHSALDERSVRASAPDAIRFPDRRGTVFANGQRTLGFRESRSRVCPCVPCRRVPLP